MSALHRLEEGFEISACDALTTITLAVKAFNQIPRGEWLVLAGALLLLDELRRIVQPALPLDGSGLRDPMIAAQLNEIRRLGNDVRAKLGHPRVDP